MSGRRVEAVMLTTVSECDKYFSMCFYLISGDGCHHENNISFDPVVICELRTIGMMMMPLCLGRTWLNNFRDVPSNFPYLPP
jgi:hypothetical protein